MNARDESSRWIFAVADVISLNVAFLAAWGVFEAFPSLFPWEFLDIRELLPCWNIAAMLVLAFFSSPVVAHRGVRSDMVASRAVAAGGILTLLFLACVAGGKFAMPGRRRICVLLAVAPTAIFISHMLCLRLMRHVYRLAGFGRRIVFVGDSESMQAISRDFAADGVHVESVSPGEAIARLRDCRCDEVYCSLARDVLPVAKDVFDYCENNLIRFFGVPENGEYFGRNMLVSAVGDVAVLVPREEPLRRLSNRFLKRSLDIVVSLVFLLTLFPPIALFVAWKIKSQSPGPVFFRQRRHGLNGREFMCIKFRSMHVNDKSDTAQTAVNDPRKCPFGDFMRRTNIDELPQFVNVLLGDMSVVGPRPHPVKMTDDFGAVVDRYRVRLYAKPGITGWAQVKGCRGAAMEVGQMIRRVRLDIWYLEHWTFWLDLRIIAKTALQTVSGRNENAF